MEQLFSAIPTVLEGVDPRPEIDEAIVFAAWSRCAGELLRERTVALHFAENRLVIAVPDVTWQRHLEELCPQILVRINSFLEHQTVRYIELRIDESAVKAANNTSKGLNCNAGVALDVAPSLRSAANAIVDDGLRDQFLGAAASYLAKNKL